MASRMLCLSAAIFIAVASGSLSIALAQDQKPPVKIGGFEYRFIPQGRIHMNVCQVENCVAGSKVSYVFYAPEETPDFEIFKLSQQRTVEAMQSRLPEGAAITLDPPEQSQEDFMTVFSATRELRAASGEVLVTQSRQYHTKDVIIAVISSSTDRRQADANGMLFAVGLLAWSRTIKKADQ